MVENKIELNGKAEREDDAEGEGVDRCEAEVEDEALLNKVLSDLI